jgi:signal transduction histidine kinase
MQGLEMSATSTDKTLSWVKDLIINLIEDGFNIQYIERLPAKDVAYTLSADVRFYVTCHIPTAETCKMFSNPTQKVILISDEYITIPPTTADFSFPNHEQYVTHQLHSLLTMDKSNLEAQAHTHQLANKLHKRNEEVELIKNAIVRNVSHELKTPLLQVKSAVSLMAEDNPNTDLTNYAKNAMARLELLVKNITLLGTVLEVNLTPVILRDVLHYARRNISRSWQYQNASTRIHVECPDNIPPILADKQGLSTVLQLLLDNALKFSDNEVTIIAKEQDDKVIISVQDTGIGIDPKELDAIFGMFYQIDSSSTRPYGGAGIGLAVVQLILEHHNSEISVKSTIGQGSVFSFELETVKLSDDDSQI